MDKVTQLLIRACKKENPKTRLKQIYRRYYFRGASDYLIDATIIQLLSEIVDKYCKLTSYGLFLDLSDARSLIKDDRNIKDRMFDTMISTIATTKASAFTGLTPPLMFRK